jgi:hypothetical protein
MPRLAINYSKTLIYKLCCLEQNINDIYIGHTTDFTKRKYGHKSICCNSNNKHYNLKVYQTIRENGGWENWNMIQIEEYPCKNNREAESREKYWIKELNSALNSRQSFQTEEERREYLKEYQQTDKYKEYKKEYEKSDKRKEYKQSEKYKQMQKEYIKEYRQTKSLYLNELKCYNL